MCNYVLDCFILSSSCRLVFLQFRSSCILSFLSYAPSIKESPSLETKLSWCKNLCISKLSLLSSKAGHDLVGLTSMDDGGSEDRKKLTWIFHIQVSIRQRLKNLCLREGAFPVLILCCGILT